MTPADYAAADTAARKVFLITTPAGRGQHQMTTRLADNREIGLQAALSLLNAKAN